MQALCKVNSDMLVKQKAENLFGTAKAKQSNTVSLFL